MRLILVINEVFLPVQLRTKCADRCPVEPAEVDHCREHYVLLEYPALPLLWPAKR